MKASNSWSSLVSLGIVEKVARVFNQSQRAVKQNQTKPNCFQLTLI